MGRDAAMPGLGVALGLALALLGQFALDGLAGPSDAWHWIQHGVVFAGGVTTGASAVRLWSAGNQRVP
jgi:hypothetical protein